MKKGAYLLSDAFCTIHIYDPPQACKERNIKLHIVVLGSHGLNFCYTITITTET